MSIVYPKAGAVSVIKSPFAGSAVRRLIVTPDDSLLPTLPAGW